MTDAGPSDPYAPPPEGGPPPGQPPYGQPPYGQPPYGQPAYGQPPWQQQPYAWGPPPPHGAYASWGRRVGGYLLDYLLLLPFFIVASVAESTNSSGGAAFGLLVDLGAVVFGLWNQVFRQGNTGQSLGKGWVGIRLVRERDGQPLGPGMTFVRAIAHILDAIPCYIGFLWPLWDSKRQTFADKVCSTVVVPT